MKAFLAVLLSLLTVTGDSAGHLISRQNSGSMGVYAQNVHILQEETEAVSKEQDSAEETASVHVEQEPTEETAAVNVEQEPEEETAAGHAGQEEEEKAGSKDAEQEAEAGAQTNAEADAEESSTAGPQVSAPSAILMEASTGTVICEKDADTPRPPASVTKVMTMLLIFDALESGKIKLEDEVTVSEYAASMGGSQVFLEPGETQTVDTMLKCISVASANDACAAFKNSRPPEKEEAGLSDTVRGAWKHQPACATNRRICSWPASSNLRN